MRDERLAAAYASADVFVFPSLTDTFGLVLLEALASGLPVAAHPVVGPIDVIGYSGAGALDANLGRAALAALSIPRELARAHALTFSPNESARQFVDNVFAAYLGRPHWVNASSAARDAPRPRPRSRRSRARLEALRESGGND
jgi:glycosyltransferase involved in cell wall biosynthesis